MQPARIKPHAKEHTNNPVQKPNFRGHAAGDGEVTRAGGSQMAAPTGKGTPTDDHSRRPETLQGRQWKGGPRGRCCHDAARRVPSCPVARAPCDVSIVLEVKGGGFSTRGEGHG